MTSFGRGQTAQRSRFFPCNAIDIMLKLSMVWRRPNHGFRAIGRGHVPVALPPPLDPPMFTISQTKSINMLYNAIVM